MLIKMSSTEAGLDGVARDGSLVQRRGRSLVQIFNFLRKAAFRNKIMSFFNNFVTNLSVFGRKLNVFVVPWAQGRPWGGAEVP